MAAPMTAAPMTVPRILTVPRDRTEDSAAHGEMAPSKQADLVGVRLLRVCKLPLLEVWFHGATLREC